MPRTFKVLSLITLQTIPPGTTTTQVMSTANRVKAMNAAARIGPWILQYSQGMGTVESTIKVVDVVIPASDFYSPDGVTQYPAPKNVVLRTGDDGAYDFVTVFATSAQTVPNGYNGYAALSGSGGAWTRPEHSDATNVYIHELGHLIEAHMYNNGYLTWPVCSENDPPSPGRSMHCGHDEPYLSNGSIGSRNPAWFSVYFSGTTFDSKGMKQAAWNILTPIEKAEKVLPDRTKPYASPWGQIAPIVIPAPTGA